MLVLRATKLTIHSQLNSKIIILIDQTQIKYTITTIELYKGTKSIIETIIELNKKILGKILRFFYLNFNNIVFRSLLLGFSTLSILRN